MASAALSAPASPAAAGNPRRSGVVNLFSIESPGLTASLAIGDYVGELLAG